MPALEQLHYYRPAVAVLMRALDQSIADLETLPNVSTRLSSRLSSRWASLRLWCGMGCLGAFGIVILGGKLIGPTFGFVFLIASFVLLAVVPFAARARSHERLKLLQQAAELATGITLRNL